MTWTIYDDMNPDYAMGREDQPRWEPWEDDDIDDDFFWSIFCCDFCGDPNVRDDPEPFGGKRCCDPCFSLLIGGELDDRPWRCGNDPR